MRRWTLTWAIILIILGQPQEAHALTYLALACFAGEHAKEVTG